MRPLIIHSQANFTAVSERLSGDELVRLLGDYFTAMCHEIELRKVCPSLLPFHVAHIIHTGHCW